MKKLLLVLLAFGLFFAQGSLFAQEVSFEKSFILEQSTFDESSSEIEVTIFDRKVLLKDFTFQVSLPKKSYLFIAKEVLATAKVYDGLDRMARGFT